MKLKSYTSVKDKHI